MNVHSPKSLNLFEIHPNLNTCFDSDHSKKIFDLCLDQEKLKNLSVDNFMEMFVK